MREQAEEMLSSNDCRRRVGGLRMLKKAEGESAAFRGHTIDVLSFCEAPRFQALALVIGMDTQDDLVTGERKVLEDSMGSISPTLRGTAAFILARRGGLSRKELREAIEVADEKEELLLLCGADRRAKAHARCDHLRASFVERVQQLLRCEGDEIVFLKTQILGNLFPQKALGMLDELARTEHGQPDSNMSLIRDAWARSTVSQALNDSLSGLGNVSRSDVKQIEFLRLATPSAISVLRRALSGDDLELRLAAIQASGELRSAAVELAEALAEIALSAQEPARREAAMALTLVAPSRAEQFASEVRSEYPELYLAVRRRLLEDRLD